MHIQVIAGAVTVDIKKTFNKSTVLAPSLNTQDDSGPMVKHILLRRELAFPNVDKFNYLRPYAINLVSVPSGNTIVACHLVPFVRMLRVGIGRDSTANIAIGHLYSVLGTRIVFKDNRKLCKWYLNSNKFGYPGDVIEILANVYIAHEDSTLKPQGRNTITTSSTSEYKPKAYDHRFSTAVKIDKKLTFED